MPTFFPDKFEVTLLLQISLFSHTNPLFCCPSPPFCHAGQPLPPIFAPKPAISGFSAKSAICQPKTDNMDN
jgi:hypothetical protein